MEYHDDTKDRFSTISSVTLCLHSIHLKITEIHTQLEVLAKTSKVIKPMWNNILNPNQIS